MWDGTCIDYEVRRWPKQRATSRLPTDRSTRPPASPAPAREFNGGLGTQLRTREIEQPPSAYSAFDQGAQLWVLATLIMASVTMYRRFVAPLTDTDLDAFLRENAIFGQVFGLQEGALPLAWKDFHAYWRSMIKGYLLGSHPLCGEVARAAVSPDAPWSMRCLSPVFSALALEYVPAPLRRRLGFRADGDAALWRILDRILPIILRSVPARWRLAPAYHRAINRAGS